MLTAKVPEGSVLMKRNIILAFIMCILLCGCGKEQQVEKVENVEVPKSQALVECMPSVKNVSTAKNENILTGIPSLTSEAIGKRPVAVMINNVKAALPQYGISAADVIFELPVEGDLTRLMALYGDYTQMPDICAIRSCRYYYPAIAKGFDAFYVHWGIDQSVIGYVDGLKLDKYDGLTNQGELFARDTARKNAGYSLEHTGYFKGTQFAEVVTKQNKRTDLLDSKKGTAFRFCNMGTSVTPSGNSCTKVDVKFGSASASFSYDAEQKLYYKKINGQVHKDGKTGEQLSFTNVFVLETSISVRDEIGHKKLNWYGSSNAKGYYFSNGTMQEIRWSKANGEESSYLKFYDVNGKELTINRGKSYIAYTYAGKTSWE